ncbi:MAG TPA: type VI secretion system baseplate subunit TssE, partial [Polyangiaceae bacterium]
KERLQPSLLDRLTDDEPDQKLESRDKRVLSTDKLRESVRRDLTWLFNTPSLAAVVDLTDYPEVERSTINYGLPDLTGRAAASIEIASLERLLRRAILDFEPRLLKDSINVKLVANPEQMTNNAMCFDIDAELWSEPIPLRLFLRTEVDLENGDIRLSENGGKGSG